MFWTLIRALVRDVSEASLLPCCSPAEHGRKGFLCPAVIVLSLSMHQLQYEEFSSQRITRVGTI